MCNVATTALAAVAGRCPLDQGKFRLFIDTGASAGLAALHWSLTVRVATARERSLQGCYADIDGVLSTLAVLRRAIPGS